MNREILNHFKRKDEAGEWYDLKDILLEINHMSSSVITEMNRTEWLKADQDHLCGKMVAEKLVESLVYIIGLDYVLEEENDEWETKSKN